MVAPKKNVCFIFELKLYRSTTLRLSINQYRRMPKQTPYLASVIVFLDHNGGAYIMTHNGLGSIPGDYSKIWNESVGSFSLSIWLCL